MIYKDIEHIFLSGQEAVKRLGKFGALGKDMITLKKDFNDCMLMTTRIKDYTRINIFIDIN